MKYEEETDLNRNYVGAFREKAISQESWILTDDPIKVMKSDDPILVGSVEDLKMELMRRQGVTPDPELNYFVVYGYEKSLRGVNIMVYKNPFITRPEDMKIRYRYEIGEDSPDVKAQKEKRYNDYVKSVSRQNPGVKIEVRGYPKLDKTNAVIVNKKTEKSTDGEFIYENDFITFDPAVAQRQMKASKSRKGSAHNRRTARLKRGVVTKSELSDIAGNIKSIVDGLKPDAGGADLLIQCIPYNDSFERLIKASTWGMRLLLLVAEEKDIRENLYIDVGDKQIRQECYDSLVKEVTEVVKHLENPKNLSYLDDFIEVFTAFLTREGIEVN